MSGASLLVAVGLALGAASPSAPDVASLVSWEEIGPAPLSSGPYTGRVSAVAPSATSPNRLYVAGADGGVWRTDDAGASWTPLSDDMPTLAMGALAVDPTDDLVVYAGTGEANYANHSRYGLGLYKSTDGGSTWQHLGEATFGGRTFSRILIDPSNTSVLYASIARAGGFPELAAAKGHPGATGERGVYKSTDAGLTWTRLAGLPDLAATDVTLDPQNPSTLYAGVGRIFGDAQNGIYKSVDGGASWSKLGGGLPTTDVGRISVQCAPSQPGRVYTLITGVASSTGGSAEVRGAYRTDNGGTSWTSLPVSGSLQSSYGWYLSVVAVHPTDPNLVVMGGLDLTRSTNGGSSWSTITPPHVDLHAAAWDAAGRLVAGDDGGVHRSTNNGSSWTSIHAGMGLIQLYAGLSSHPTDDERFFGGFQDNGTGRRSAAGTSWDAVIGGDGGWTQLDQLNPLRVFGESQGSGNLYRSTNGGSSFSGAGSGINSGDRNAFLPPYVIQANDSNRLLYATHRIYRSTNGGTSWSAISGDLTNGQGAIRALAQSRTDPLRVYAATNDGKVLRSDDGGSVWTTVRTGHDGWPRVTREITVHPQNPLTVYLATAVYGANQVEKSTDGGVTWKSLDGDLPDVPVNVVEVVPTPGLDHLFAGSDQGLWFSADNGQSWHRYGKGLPNACVIDLAIDRDRGRIVVATQGRGVWRAPLLLSKKP